MPALQPPGACTGVWAIPRSLATTCGVTVCFPFLRVLRCFSSPGSLSAGWRTISLHDTRLPHSDIHGSRGCLHLPVAFRSLPRPSSSLGAKASPIRPCLLPVLGTGPLGPVVPFWTPRTPWCAWRLLAARSCFPLPALSMNFPQLRATPKKGRHPAACRHRRSDPAVRPPQKGVPVYCLVFLLGRKTVCFPLVGGG